MIWELNWVFMYGVAVFSTGCEKEVNERLGGAKLNEIFRNET
jgi:hypothetical protein